MRLHLASNYGSISSGQLRLMFKQYLTESGWVVASELTSSVTLRNAHSATITIDEANVITPVVRCTTVDGRGFPNIDIPYPTTMRFSLANWVFMCDEEKFYFFTDTGLYYFGPISTKNPRLRNSHLLLSTIGVWNQPSLYSPLSLEWAASLDTWAEGVPARTPCYLIDDAEASSRNSNNTGKGVLDVYPINVKQKNGRYCGHLKGVWLIGDASLPQKTPIPLDSGSYLYPIAYGTTDKLLGFEIDG